MLHTTERRYDVRSELIRSTIYALWEHGHELLESAAIELSVDLEVFAVELDLDVSRQHPLADEVKLLQTWLEARNYPDWEPYPGSVLNNLTEQELYLVLAKAQLDLSGMTAQAGGTPRKEIEHRNLALTASERALAHAEHLSFAVQSSRLH